MSEFVQSFYVTGGTLASNALSYVHRDADETLFRSLLEGEFCYILTARQMGKSSLMVRTASRLRDSGVGVAVVDLTYIGQNLTIDQWYKGILNRIGRHLGLERELDDFWYEYNSLPPLERWLSAFERVVLLSSQRIVVFVDEIDLVRSLSFRTDEFFAAIRSCDNRRAEDPQFSRLTFCLLGVAAPTDLINDAVITPFNIGTRIELQDFNPTEAEALTAGISITGRNGQALLERIMYWTGGHPYLTQRLCAAVEENEAVLDARHVDALCSTMLLSSEARHTESNLTLVSDRLLKSGHDVSSLLDLYIRVHSGRAPVKDEPGHPLYDALRLSGIVRVRDGRLVVRNRVYALIFDKDWVQKNLPGAEVLRQRRAYRRGIVRASAVASVVFTIVSALAVANYINSKKLVASLKREARATRAVDDLSYEADMLLVQSTLDKYGVVDLPTVSNLLNSGSRLRMCGFEWYYWNALFHQELATMTGHDDTIMSASFSTDCKYVITGSIDGTARMWSAATGRELRRFIGNYGAVCCAALSRDGSRVITGSADGNLHIWDAATGAMIRTLTGHTGQVWCVAVSPDDRLIAAGGMDKTVLLWDAASGRSFGILRGHTDNVRSVAFSPDGKRLVTASWDKSARVWDINSQRELFRLKGHTEIANSAVFSRHGNIIATGSNDGIVRVCDAKTGELLRRLAGDGSVASSVSISPDGESIASSTFKGIVWIWSVRTGKLLRALRGHAARLYTVSYSSDGNQIVTGSADHTARIWDNRLPTDRLTLRGHRNGVTSAAFSPDGQHVVTGSKDKTAVIWNLATGKAEYSLRYGTGEVWSVDYSPDGKHVAVANLDKTVAIFSAQTGKQELVFHEQAPVYAVKFSPDGGSLATANWDGTVGLWDATTGSRTRKLIGHTVPVFALAFSPDGSSIASGSRDQTAILWDVKTGAKVRTFGPHGGTVLAAAFSHDGKHLALTYGDRNSDAVVWDVDTGKEVFSLLGHRDEIWSIAYSPDGSRILTSSWDGTARVWSAENGWQLLDIPASSGQLASAAYSHDGKNVVTASLAGTATVWPYLIRDPAVVKTP